MTVLFSAEVIVIYFKLRAKFVLQLNFKTKMIADDDAAYHLISIFIVQRYRNGAINMMEMLQSSEILFLGH